MIILFLGGGIRQKELLEDMKERIFKSLFCHKMKVMDLNYSYKTL